ncbi:3'-5' exonuclease-like [Andrographis paniculata]|uniref:3'-5' exonuclease-like n=1 Tax=Andrographis paniculata TaxID=175694 RepID=UPI0021E8AD5D|nr:3'-5' exonuclease-like [Andrographis paniculata]
MKLKGPRSSIPPRLRRRQSSPEKTQSLFPALYSVLFYNDIVHVTVAKKAIHVHQWISYIRHLNRRFVRTLVGLDTEWLPNRAPGDDHPVAIIQLCVGSSCLIFQILHSDSIPVSLLQFLADPSYIFCGVGIEGDVEKLYSNHGLFVGCYEDLNNLNKMATWGENRRVYRYMGLKKMAMAVLGKEMKKPLEVTLSNWDAENLDPDQVEYAAIDAFVSFQIAVRLTSWIAMATPF